MDGGLGRKDIGLYAQGFDCFSNRGQNGEEKSEPEEEPFDLLREYSLL